MSIEPANAFSTDNVAHLYQWDEIEGWRLMLEHFDLVEGFSLIVAFAPDEWGVALVRERLTEVLGGPKVVVRVRFDPAEGTDSLAESLLALPEPASDVRAVWIDTDPAKPDRLEQREKDWGEALAKLNRYRNTLQARFACTLVFALPSRFQKTFAETAPDIWSIRSGIFRIEPPGTSRAAIARLPADEWKLLDTKQDLKAGDPDETLAQAKKLRGKPGREVLLARLLQRTGNQARARLDWQLAEECLTEAYELEEAIGWGDPELHWDIATNLASVFYDLARYDRAEHYLNRALEIAEQHFGANDPRTALSLNNLAQLLQATNRLAEAEPLMRRAWEIFRDSLGDEHPHTNIAAQNLELLEEELEE